MNIAAVTTRRRKRRKYFLLIGLILAAVFIVWLALHLALSGGQASQSRGGRRSFGQFSGPQPVQAATALRGDMPITLTALGTVTPLATVTVRSQINGQLMQIAFTEGQLVKKGDFLALIDPRPSQVALEQAEGALAKDQGLLDQAQADLKRYKMLASQDSISAQQLDDQTYLVEQYSGALKSDQAQVDSAKLNLAYCHVTAPVSGRVGLRQVDLGNYVQTSDTNGIVVITEPSPISVLFTLPEDSIPQVMQRVTAGATLPVTLLDRNNTVKLATGTLTAVDNQVNTTTGTVQLRAVFQNTDGRLFPNEFVNVVLLVDTLKGTVLVPSAAVQRGAPGTFVYKVKGDGTVTLQVVSLGPTDGNQVAILSGLTPGVQVVTDGAEQLKDGSQVTLPQQQPATAAPAAGTHAAAHQWHKGAADNSAGSEHHHHTPPPSGGS